MVEVVLNFFDNGCLLEMLGRVRYDVVAERVVQLWMGFRIASRGGILKYGTSQK